MEPQLFLPRLFKTLEPLPLDLLPSMSKRRPKTSNKLTGPALSCPDLAQGGQLHNSGYLCQQRCKVTSISAKAKQKAARNYASYSAAAGEILRNYFRVGSLPPSLLLSSFPFTVGSGTLFPFGLATAGSHFKTWQPF